MKRQRDRRGGEGTEEEGVTGGGKARGGRAGRGRKGRTDGEGNLAPVHGHF